MKKSLVIIIAAATISWVPANANYKAKASVEQGQEDKLQLNKGKRWKANAETTTGVNNMIKIVEIFATTKNVKFVKDYNALAKDLRAEMNVIFDKCTMKGESHNNLHAFLVPIFGYLKEMESDDIESCEKNMKSMRLHLGEYEKFFE